MTDYYALLGVPRDASVAAVHAAFRRMAKRLHPDVSALPGAADRFRRIMEAHDILTHPLRRAAYDASYAQYEAELKSTVDHPFSAQDGYLRPDAAPTAGPRPAPPAAVGGQWRAAQPAVRAAATPPSAPEQALSPQRPTPPWVARPGGARRSATPPRSAQSASSNARRTAPRGPVVPVSAVRSVGSVGAGSPAVLGARAAAVEFTRPVEHTCRGCGVALASAAAAICPTCLDRYGAFEDHLAEALGRPRS